MSLVYIVLLPFFASLLAAILPRGSHNRESLLSLVTALACLLAVVLETPQVLGTGGVIIE